MRLQEKRSLPVKYDARPCSAVLKTILPQRLLGLLAQMVAAAYQVLACNFGGKTDNVTGGSHLEVKNLSEN